MNIRLQQLAFAVIFVVFGTVAVAQPNITYTSPPTYLVSSAITTLSPANTGSAVTAYAYNTTSTNFVTPASASYSVITDISDNIYTASANGDVQRYTPAGAVITPTPTTFPTSDRGLVIDNLNNLYVTDNTSRNVYKINLTSGTASTITGFAANSTLMDIAADASNNVYVVDQANGRVYKIAAGATTATSYVTNVTTTAYGITVDQTTGDIYVSTTAGALRQILAGTTTSTAFATGLGGARGLGSDESGNIYAADLTNNTIKKITTAGVVTNLSIGTLNAPTDVAIANTGIMYIANNGTGNIRKVVPSGGYYINSVLPAGLNFNNTNGQITGTPTLVSPTTTYTITAWNASGSSTTTVALGIGPIVTTPAAICAAGTFSIPVSGGTPSGGTYKLYAASTGGTALASTTTTTLVSSTITATGTYYVSYTPSAGAESARTPVTLTVSSVPILSTPPTGTGVAYFSYPFSNNANDISGNGNNGTLQGTPLATADRYNITPGAYLFNGTSQYVSTTPQVVNPTNFSISLWFKTNVAGGKLFGFGANQTGLNTQYDRHIYMNSTGQLYYGIYNGTAPNYYTLNTTGTYIDNAWHHVVVTQSSTTGAKLYVDGVLQGADATMKVPENTTGYWRIAYDNTVGWPDASGTFFKGSMDDISVYKTAIAATDVYVQYGAGATPVCAGSDLNLTANTVAGSTYSWTGPNGFTSSAQNPTITSATADNSGTYVLTVTNPNCGPTTINVQGIVISPAFTSTQVPVNTNSTLTYTGTRDPTTTYSWAFGTGSTPTTSTSAGPVSVQWNTAGAKPVTLTITSVAAGCSSSIAQSVFVGPTTYGTYNYVDAITINSTSLGLTSNQINFPVLLKIVDVDLIISANCNNKVIYPDGPNYDFAFYDPATATELNYQVESYDQGTGTLLVWVKMPTLTYNANNTLRFYFGSTTPVTTHDPTFYGNTWSTDYVAVYHFNEPAFTGQTPDGTINNHIGVTANIVGTDLIAGKIGNAYTFDGYTTKKTITANSATITGPFTLSAWVNLGATGQDQKILTNQGATGSITGGYKLGAYTTNLPEMESGLTNNRGGAPDPTAFNTSEWHYVQGVYNGANLSMYVDGSTTAYKVSTSNTNPTATTALYIGVGEGGNQLYFNGIIDEARVLKVARSAEWLRAEYRNQNAQSTFTTVGATSLTTNSNLATLSGGYVYTWKGTTNNIATGANWTNTTLGTTGTAPSLTSGLVTIVIPSGFTTPQLPTTGGPFAIYGLTIASGAAINLNGQVLNIGCNIYNNGTINTAGVTNASTLTWNGLSAKQAYIASATTNTTQVGNMIVNNTANTTAGTITISGGPVNIYNTLTLTSGNLVINNTLSGSLTLKSSGTVTARVAEITSTARSITGNVTVERWFTGGVIANRGWRLMSSPVNNTSTVSASALAMFSFTSLKNNLNITGLGTNFDASANNGPTILFYNTASKLFSWPADPTTATNPIGAGFYFYFRGSRTGINKLVKVSTAYTPPEANVVGLQTGTLNQQSFSYTLSNANAGFNQAGNPYPSSISIPSGSGSGGTTPYIGTTGFVYTYVSNANSVISQPSVTTIASGQGFFVKSNNATSSITFTESLKVATQPTGTSLLLGKPVGTEPPMISLKMVQDSANYDIAFVRFLDTYKKEFIETEDAADLNGQGQNVFFGAMTNDNHLVVIASQPIEKQKTSVFLSVNANFSGLYSIEKIDLTGIPAVYDVWLKDHFKNDSLNLRANSVYKFNLDKTNPQTFGNSRFQIVIRKKSLPPYKLISFKGQRTGTDVLLKWNTENEYDYTAFEVQKSADGVNFEAVKNMQSSSQGTYSFKDVYNTGSTANIYYRLKQTDINDLVTYSNIIIISTRGDGSLSIFPNPATNVIRYRLKEDPKGSVRLRIINASGITVKSGTFTTTTGQQDIAALTPGSYTIEITDLNSKKLILTGKFIKL